MKQIHPTTPTMHVGKRAKTHLIGLFIRELIHRFNLYFKIRVTANAITDQISVLSFSQSVHHTVWNMRPWTVVELKAESMASHDLRNVTDGGNTEFYNDINVETVFTVGRSCLVDA